MLLDQDVLDGRGELVLGQGLELNAASIRHLDRLARERGGSVRYRVLVPPPERLALARLLDMLEGDRARLFNRHPAIAADLLANIPRLREVSDIIRLQHGNCNKNFAVAGMPRRTAPWCPGGYLFPLPSSALWAGFGHRLRVCARRYIPETLCPSLGLWRKTGMTWP